MQLFFCLIIFLIIFLVHISTRNVSQGGGKGKMFQLPHIHYYRKGNQYNWSPYLPEV